MDKPYYLIRGTEEYLISHSMKSAISHITAFFKKKGVVDLEYTSIDCQDETALEDLYNAFSPSLFGSTSCVIVRNVNAADDAIYTLLYETIQVKEIDALILTYVGNKGNSKFLKALKEYGVPEKICEKPRTRKEWNTFIFSEFVRHKKKISQEGVEFLRQVIGDDMRSLASATGQIATDLEKTDIDVVDIQKHYEGFAEVKAWNIAEAVADKDFSQVISLYRWSLLHDPNSLIPILNSVTQIVSQLMLLSGHTTKVSDAEIATEIGLPTYMSWKVQALRKKLRRWDEEQLSSSLMKLFALDVPLKGGMHNQALETEQKSAELEKVLIEIIT